MRSKYPVMLYDGDCKFCKGWITRWAKLTENRVLYLPYQENLNEFPQVTQKDCEKSIQFIETDGKVYRTAEGVLRSLVYAKKYSWIYKLYKKSRLFSAFTEWMYSSVAKNREFLSRIGF